jgi:hypothetical protein
VIAGMPADVSGLCPLRGGRGTLAGILYVKSPGGAERTKHSAGHRASLGPMAGEFEKLAHDAALRGLDKQEGLLEELRSRTGVLLAASSLAASFLGQQAFRHPSPRALVIVALATFVISIGASVFILLPRRT